MPPSPKSGFQVTELTLAFSILNRPGQFLAGVECDGSAYHSSRSARDRDRLREEVLRGLGWTIVRVWSTDWFDDPNRETEKLEKRLQELRGQQKATTSPFRIAPSMPASAKAEVAENSRLTSVASVVPAEPKDALAHTSGGKPAYESRLVENKTVKLHPSCRLILALNSSICGKE